VSYCLYLCVSVFGNIHGCVRVLASVIRQPERERWASWQIRVSSAVPPEGAWVLADSAGRDYQGKKRTAGRGERFVFAWGPDQLAASLNTIDCLCDISQHMPPILSPPSISQGPSCTPAWEPFQTHWYRCQEWCVHQLQPRTQWARRGRVCDREAEGVWSKQL
jgi:hypothetical protein